MKKTFFLRVFIIYFSIFLVLQLSTFLIINYIFKTQSTKILSKEMKNIALAIEPSLRKVIPQKNPLEIEKNIREITEKTGIRITLIDKNGTVIVDSQKQAETMENHSNRPEFREALKKGESHSIRWSSTLNKYFYYYAIRTVESSGVLRLSVPLDETKKINSFFIKQTFLITLILLVIGTIALIFAAQILTSPVKEILKISEKASAGFSENIIVVRKTDEIGKIIKNINNLGLMISQLNKEKKLGEEEIKKFLNLLDVPIAIIMQQGDIILATNRFEKIFGIEKKDGFWWEKIKIFEINEIINNSFENKKDIQKEIIIYGRTFLCKTSFLQDRLILVMFDISDMKQAEKTRKDFVIAASHELKTPLTAIKGYIETLLDEINNPQQREFIKIINYNISRLEQIVEDLITLSRLENDGVRIELQKVNIKEIATNVIILYEKKAREKGIKLKLKAQDVPLIKVDGFKIEQMLINLVDNAVRFTEKGEVIIFISYEKQPSRIKIEIADTGIGIPPQHLSRIFERFYVVDKARSRQTGGTGLGLSIVKHIVLLHNGTIDVQSKENKGTKFTIEFPVKP